MKNWMNADLVVVDVTETANGEHTQWTEGTKRHAYGNATHKTGINPNATIPEVEEIEETPGDDINTRS